MPSRVKAVAACLLGWLAGLAGAHAQATADDWHAASSAGAQLPDVVIVNHEQLREFLPTGRLVNTKRRGSLAVEVREGVYPDTAGELQPASIVVRYRNRLVAAATGYRLGSAITANGVTIESWAGEKSCAFTRWQLEFHGERMEIAATRRLRTAECAN